jgi:flagellar capping protein FliD
MKHNLAHQIGLFQTYKLLRKMVFELGGFTSVSDPLEAAGVTIDIDFGTWTENNADNFSFSEASDNVTKQVSFTSKSLTDIAALFNDIDGISAQIVDTTGDGTNYSLVLSSENTGAENGFRLSETGGSTRWETTLIPSSTPEDNTVNSPLMRRLVLMGYKFLEAEIR